MFKNLLLALSLIGTCSPAMAWQFKNCNNSHLETVITIKEDAECQSSGHRASYNLFRDNCLSEDSLRHLENVKLDTPYFACLSERYETDNTITVTEIIELGPKARGEFPNYH